MAQSLGVVPYSFRMEAKVTDSLAPERVPALIEKILDQSDRIAELTPANIAKVKDYLEALRLEVQNRLLETSVGTGDADYDPVEYTKALGRVEIISRIREDLDRVLESHFQEEDPA